MRSQHTRVGTLAHGRREYSKTAVQDARYAGGSGFGVSAQSCGGNQRAPPFLARYAASASRSASLISVLRNCGMNETPWRTMTFTNSGTRSVRSSSTAGILDLQLLGAGQPRRSPVDPNPCRGTWHTNTHKPAALARFASLARAAAHGSLPTTAPS